MWCAFTLAPRMKALAFSSDRSPRIVGETATARIVTPPSLIT
jgi:hypothetical protein